MSDFIIVFERGFMGTSAIEESLQERPGMNSMPARSWHFPWGGATLQQSRAKGNHPYQLGTDVYFSVGRPRVMGWAHEDDGENGFTRHVARLSEEPDPESLYCELTGTFVLGSCTAAGVTLFTDRIGLFPVYLAISPNHTRYVLGTMPEIVATLAGRGAAFDLVSLAEIISRNTATFPYTSRNGMVELEPGSTHTFILDGSDVLQHQSRSLWVPREPSEWLSLERSQAELASAIRFAGDDLTRRNHKVAFLLSGGADSRVVLASVPRERRAIAITFADHENREVEFSRAIAEAAGISHQLANRSPHFYAELMEAESKLIGIEKGQAHSHGMAALGQFSNESFDLLLSGDRCDTLLKSMYLSNLQKAAIASGIRYKPRDSANELPAFWKQDACRLVVDLMTPRIVQQMLERIRHRLDELRKIRRSNACEWFALYPMSRHKHSAFAQCAVRQCCYDLPYIHSKVIDVAVAANPASKFSRKLTIEAFKSVAGELNHLRNSNNGLSANASSTRYFFHKLASKVLNKLPKLKANGARRSSDAYSWFTEDSWVDFRELQKHSEVWIRLREESVAQMDQLGEIFNVNVAHAFGQYNQDLTWESNYTVVKLARAMGISRLKALEKV